MTHKYYTKSSFTACHLYIEVDYKMITKCQHSNKWYCQDDRGYIRVSIFNFLFSLILRKLQMEESLQALEHEIFLFESLVGFFDSAPLASPVHRSDFGGRFLEYAHRIGRVRAAAVHRIAGCLGRGGFRSCDRRWSCHLKIEISSEVNECSDGKVIPKKCNLIFFKTSVYQS